MSAVSSRLRQSDTETPFDNFRVVTASGLLRSGALVRTNRASMTQLRADDLIDRGPTTLLDLRTDDERRRHPLALGNVPVASTPLPWVAWEFPRERSQYQRTALKHYSALAFSPEGMSALGQSVNRLAESSHGTTVVMCEGGRDRTGVLVALILALLGAPWSTVGADYSETERAWLRWRRQAAHQIDLRTRAGSLNTIAGAQEILRTYQLQALAPAALIISFLEQVRGKFGTIAAYVTALEVPPNRVAQIADNWLTS